MASPSQKKAHLYSIKVNIGKIRLEKIFALKRNFVQHRCLATGYCGRALEVLCLPQDIVFQLEAHL